MTTTLTLPAVLAELESVGADFGYPVDWACSIIEARLQSKFEDSDDNVLIFRQEHSDEQIPTRSR